MPDEATPIHVLRRGDWANKAEQVGMRPPTVMITSDAPELPPSSPRPRSELAQWLTDAQHPLTARVMANRVWQQHFGRGLVATANDFGVNGERPSHPALLDHLAHAFVAGGWRLKPLHRLIVLSSTYRQSSHSPYVTRGKTIDPKNTLLWRFNQRRLSAEEIRDAMLAVSGRLNGALGGESVMVEVDQELIDQLYKPSQWQVTSDQAQHARRSIYLIAKRNLRLPFLEVFDQPALQTSCPGRQQSTHAPQSLELLNGTHSNDMAEVFAQRLSREAGDDLVQQVNRAFWLAVSRPPTPEEQRLSIEFLKAGTLREFALAMLNLNAFLYVN